MLKIRKIRINADCMYANPREFIHALGGYRAVAAELTKKHTTVHSHMQAGVLPAAWYDALCKLARDGGKEEPQRALFSFLQVVEDAA
jgi:hypothetical protein